MCFIPGKIKLGLGYLRNSTLMGKATYDDVDTIVNADGYIMI